MTYPSPAFREDHLDVLHAAIRELAFGTPVKGRRSLCNTTINAFTRD